MMDNHRLKSSRASWLPLILLAVTLLLLFYRLLIGEVFFWGLPALQFVPWRQFAWNLLRDGVLPLWNPYNGGGAPLFANYQSALLYPLNWAGLVLPLAWQMSVTAVLHLFIAGWGMWAFTGRLGVPELGRGLSTLAFALTGYLVARLGTYPTISAAAWLPWLLWAVLGVLSRNHRRDLAWLALFTALQLLAGHAQTAWYSLLLVGGFGLWQMFTRRPANWRRLALIAGALLLGAGVAALQLLATGELLLQSQRSDGVEMDFAMNFSYAPSRILNLLSPNVFGTPADGSYFTKGAFFEDAVYIGLLPLVSALAAALSWVWWKVRRAARPAYYASVPFWLAVVVVGVVFALGNYTPIFPFLYQHIPTFDLFQAPERWHLWTVFGLSVLAGIGVGAWGRGKWLLFGTRLLTAACLGAVVLALLAPRWLPPEVAQNDGVRVVMQAVIFTGLMGALAGDLTLIQPEVNSRRYRWWSLAVLVVVAVDLGLAGRGLNPTLPASFFDERDSGIIREYRAYWPEAAQEALMYDRLFRFDDYRVAVDHSRLARDSSLPNLNLMDGEKLLNNFDPLLIGHFADYLRLLEQSEDPSKLLMAARVTAVYDANGQLTASNSELQQWVNFADSVCWHEDDHSLKAALLSSEWPALQQVHLIGIGACPPVPDAISSDSQVLDRQLSALSSQFEVKTDTGGLLYIPHTYYPGWQAFVDSQPARILRANLAFMAVEVPAGTTEVRLDYRPWWLLPGTLISLLSLVGLLVLFRAQSPEREGSL